MSQLQLFVPTAEKACSRCGIVQPLDAFHAKCTGKGEKTAHCRDCQAKRSLELQQLADHVAELRCYTCETVKPVRDFHRSSISSSRSGKCKACNAAYHQELAIRLRAEKIASGEARQCESCGKAKGQDQFDDNAPVCRQCQQHARNVARRKEREHAIASKRSATQSHLRLCNRCHEEKAFDAFHLKNDPRRPDRRDGTCKVCRTIEASVRYQVRCNVESDFRARLASLKAERLGGRRREYVPKKEQQAAKAARLEEKRLLAAEREAERNSIDGRWNRLCASKARELGQWKEQDKWKCRATNARNVLLRRSLVVAKTMTPKTAEGALIWIDRVVQQRNLLLKPLKSPWLRKGENAVSSLRKRRAISLQRENSTISRLNSSSAARHAA